MSGGVGLYCRPLFVSLLVLWFIMCSDAVRASLITSQHGNGLKHNILSSLFTSFTHQRPLPSDLPSIETGLQTGTNAETETSRNSKEALSIIDHQSNSLWFQNNQQTSRAGIIRLQRGHRAGEVRPGSHIFTGQSQQERQSFEVPKSRFNYQPLSQKVGNSYNSYPTIIRKSSLQEVGVPFSSFSQVLDPKNAPNHHSEVKVPRNDSPKLATDKTARLLKAGEYWSASLAAPRGHYSGYKETNELSAVRAPSTSSGIQSSNFLGFASQTVSHAPSISDGSDTAVIKRHPSPEKVISSITDFSQRLNSVTGSETLRHKKVQSFLFKDSQTSSEEVNAVTGGGRKASSGSRVSFTTEKHKRRPSNAEIYRSFKQLHRKYQTKEENANTAQFGDQMESFTKNQRVSSLFSPSSLQLSSHPASGKDRTTGSFYHTNSEKSVIGGSANATPRASPFGNNPGRFPKSISGIGGFKNAPWTAGKEPSVASSGEKTNARQHSFDKRADYKFKIANVFPSLTPRFSFGQRRASTPTITSSKLERTPTDYQPPSSGSLDLIQVTTVSTLRPITSGFKDVWPESDQNTSSNSHQKQFRVSKRIYGLNRSGARPLEGAKTLVRKADNYDKLQQSFDGFKLRSPQIWQRNNNRIHRWFNQTGETESESRFRPDKYKEINQVHRFLGFQSIQNTTGNTQEQTPATSSPAQTDSSAHLRSESDLKVQTGTRFESKMPKKNKTQLVAAKAHLLSSSTSSTVMGKRVKEKHSRKLNGSTSSLIKSMNVAIVRLPKRPTRLKAIMYTDIVGSASFSSVRATTQTPITPADRSHSPNTTAVIEHKEDAGARYWTLNSDDGANRSGNTSRSPDANVTDQTENFISSIEEKKHHDELDKGMKTFANFSDSEGSGSGVFDLSDISSTDHTNSQRLGADLSELNYLRISTGNVSFKSVKLSRAEE